MQRASERTSPSARQERNALALLMLATAVLFFFRLGATDLWAPDEPRFAAVAEELRSLRHGVSGLVVLHLNDAPYAQKPPLYYWLAALIGGPGGRVGEVAARLPSALAGFLCIWLTSRLGVSLTNRFTVGFWSAAILLTVFRFSHLARRAQLDVMLTLLVLVALNALWNLYREQPPSAEDAPASKRGMDFYLLHTALALGLLTKGPVALLPIPAFALFLFWQGSLHRFKRIFPLWSFAISLGPGLLWISTVIALTPSGFFEEAVLDNIFGRFFSGTAHVRPLYYYLTRYPMEFLPWSLLWPFAGWQAWRTARRPEDDWERAAARFAISWIALWFVFFSLSAGKRGLYLLPTFPAVAVLCGNWLVGWLEDREGLTGALKGLLLGLAAVTLAIAGWIVLGGGLEFERYPGFAISTGFGLWMSSIPIAAIALYCTLASRHVPLVKRFIAVAIAIGAIEFCVFTVVYPAFDDEKSPRPIALAALEHTGPGAPIAVFARRDLVGAVAYYSGRKIHHVETSADLEAFSNDGGTSVIVKASKLSHFPGLEDYEILADVRKGARKLLVLVLRD